MWSILTLMALGELAAHGNVVGPLRAAYPSDPVKRDALHRCGEMDSGFSRFSRHDRDICYQALRAVSGRASSNPAGEW
jgi:hypothetical protein